MEWEELDPKIQERWKDFRGIMSPDALQEFYDDLEADAEEWVRDTVATLRKPPDSKS